MKQGALVFVTICLAAAFAFCLQGYHPGAEDDGVYLSAIHKDLQPYLYPYNSAFFTVQTQLTVFDKTVAAASRVSGLPASYVCLLGQVLSIALLLWGCWRIAAYCFPSMAARCGAVLSVASLLTLSVAGTALYISDEHLHPRNVASCAIVFAIDATQRGRGARAALFLLFAIAFHPIMGAFGISFCILYTWVLRGTPGFRALRPRALRIAAVPAGWLFAPATPAWRTALEQHSYYRLSGWHWYEWLGVIGPVPILYWLARLNQRSENTRAFRLAATVTVYSVAQLAVALAMLLPPGLDRLAPFQPMRYLHLTFLFLILLGGASLGEYWLRRHVGRWLLVFLPLAAVNGFSQRLRYPGTPNLELPWTAPVNAWTKAFLWIRTNTPKDAVFALDPQYLSLQGEDNHGFRALAERSSLVDDEKDAAVATQVPQLAPTWLSQRELERGWSGWTRSDFARLAAETPVRWVVVVPRQALGLRCPYRSEAVDVCQVP